jgi:hypothetical protein
MASRAALSKGLPVSDIFREVEEDVRRERFEKLWKQYGDYAIAAFAVLIIAIAGWQFWKYYHGQQIVRASNAYATATQTASGGDPATAAGEFGTLAKDAPGGYAVLARLQQANSLMSAGDTINAVAIYKEIEGGKDPSLAAVARLRHAWAVVDSASVAQVTTILAPLNDPASEWKYAAREALAYSEYHNGDAAAAVSLFNGLAANTNAPQNLRQRAKAMATFIGAGGSKDTGTVPPAPAATPPAGPAPQNGTPTP